MDLLWYIPRGPFAKMMEISGNMVETRFKAKTNAQYRDLFSYLVSENCRITFASHRYLKMERDDLRPKDFVLDAVIAILAGVYMIYRPKGCN
jgi:hypothetical protein